jgi:hypothetical protein
MMFVRLDELNAFLTRNQEKNPIYNSDKKYLEMNLTKEVKDPYNENYKTL